MKLQDNVRAVVVKEVQQLRDPVTQSKRVRCTAAPAPAPAPVALPATAHCPASGDHPPTSTRPPPTRTAIRAAAARRPTAYGARARRPQRGHHRQGLQSERRAARRPTAYGARARAGGTCLVAVLHAASVIGCWRRAAGAASLRTAPDAPPPHLMMLAASRTRTSSTRHRHSWLPTYNNASRTRRTPPTPDDASRMQYRHNKTMCHQPWPWPHSIYNIHIHISYIYIYIY